MQLARMLGSSGSQGSDNAAGQNAGVKWLSRQLDPRSWPELKAKWLPRQ